MNIGISIIIPHFNRSQIIYETLESIKNQTINNWEIIIVDDGSSSTEFNLLLGYQSSYPNIKIFQRTSSRKKGANACRNIGVENSQYDLVMFLDSDDLLSVDCIENRLKFVDENSDMSIFNMQRFSKKPGDSLEIVNKYHQIKSAAALLNSFLVFKLPWPITSVLWKKSFLQELMFDEELIRFQDIEIHIRALLSSPTLALYPHEIPDCFYRNSSYDYTITQNKARLTLRTGFYLISKLSSSLDDIHKRKLLGFLYFLSKTFSVGIDFKFQRELLSHYLFLSKKSLELNGIILILLSNKIFLQLPGISYLKQRCFVYGRKKL